MTERGIAGLARIKTLKTLVLGGQYVRAVQLELVCLMLEDALPDLNIRGIVYCDEDLLHRQREINRQRELEEEEERKRRKEGEESTDEDRQQRASSAS